LVPVCHLWVPCHECAWGLSESSSPVVICIEQHERSASAWSARSLGWKGQPIAGEVRRNRGASSVCPKRSHGRCNGTFLSSVTMSLADKRRECWQVLGGGAMVVQTSTHPGTTKTKFELLILPRVPESCHGDRWQGIDVRGSFHGCCSESHSRLGQDRLRLIRSLCQQADDNVSPARWLDRAQGRAQGVSIRFGRPISNRKLRPYPRVIPEALFLSSKES